MGKIEIQKKRSYDNLSVTSSAEHILNGLKSELLRRPWARTSKKLGGGRKSIFEEEPVTTLKFFQPDINGYCREANYPIQQEMMDAIFGTDPYVWSTDYKRVVALFGMGSGKDHTIAKAFVYAAYWCGCLYDPQSYFGRGQGTSIDLVNVCINGYLAKHVFFKELKNVVLHTYIPGKSPLPENNYFSSKGMDIREGNDIQTKTIKFPKNVWAHCLDSQHQAGVGLNILFSCFDEIGGFNYEDADQIYENITSTQDSRFGNNSKAALISFPRDANDYMMVAFNKAQQQADKKTWIRKAATWEVNLGTKQEDFADKFASNPEGAERTYKCNVTVGEDAYYKYKELIRYCINFKRPNPVEKNKFRTFNISEISFKPWFKGMKGVWYFGHADLAKGKEGGDSAAIAICHNVRGMPVKVDEEYIKRLRKDMGIDLSSYFDKAKTGHGIFVDLLLQIRARPGREVMFQDIIDVFEYLRSNRSFDIKSVTYDGFHSIGEIQRIKDLGIESDVLSLDRDTKGHDTLKGLVYRGLIDYYPHPILIREMEEVRLQKGKVDHPEKSTRRFIMEGMDSGSKDVIDALAGSCYSAIEKFKGGCSAWWGDMADQITETFSGEFIHPEETQRKLIQSMNERAEENARKFHAQWNAPLVRRGERPDVVDPSY